MGQILRQRFVMAAIRKETNGKWTAVIKDGREYVKAKTFQTKREAQVWSREIEARLATGVDLRGGKVRVADRLSQWLLDREGMVAATTLTADQQVKRVMPRWFGSLAVNAVTEAHIERLLGEWARSESLGYASVVRLRASLSAFFTSCRRGRLVVVNPVTAVRAPRRTEPAADMLPFSEDEVEQVVTAIRSHNDRLADVVLIAAWTGLRWGELRSLHVADFAEVPTPVLLVQRSQTEGRAVKVPKSGRVRRVPVADRILPLLRLMSANKGPDDLLVTTDRGSQLHATAFKRATHWATLGRGRRLHDLRHTAGCLWVNKGVELTAVQAWMGHASISTTNRYLHYLGTGAERAGLALLNASGANPGQISREVHR